MSAAVPIVSWTFVRSILVVTIAYRRDGSTSIETHKETNALTAPIEVAVAQPLWSAPSKPRSAGGRDEMGRELANTWIGLAVLLPPPHQQRRCIEQQLAIDQPP